MPAGVQFHNELTIPGAVHPFAYVQSTDPALDGANGVAAYKAWIKSDDNSLWYRNAGNTAWVAVIGGDIVNLDWFMAWRTPQHFYMHTHGLGLVTFDTT